MEAANTAEIAMLPSAPAELKVSSEPTVVDVEADETECLDPLSRLSYQILKVCRYRDMQIFSQ